MEVQGGEKEGGEKEGGEKEGTEGAAEGAERHGTVVAIAVVGVDGGAYNEALRRAVEVATCMRARAFGTLGTFGTFVPCENCCGEQAAGDDVTPTLPRTWWITSMRACCICD